MRNLHSCLLAAPVVLAATVSAQLPPLAAGDILVSSSGNDRLLRLDFRGQELASLSFAGLAHPRGIVAAPDGTLFLSSQNSSEVLVLGRALTLQRRFATAGVTGPTGAALGANGHLYVAGFSSSNVGEYRTDGSLVRTYSDPSLRFSNCVAFHPDGSFFVSSAGTGSVVHFEANGSLRRSFTGFGLASPMGMAVWNGELFVTGGSSNNIVVFDLDGTALRQIRHADLSGPQGIAFRRDGVFATCSFYQDTVSWFDADGSHVGTMTPDSTRVPRSVAYLEGARIDANGDPVPGTPYTFDVHSPFEPGSLYANALALSTAPGLPLPDGRTIQLTPDPLFFASLSPNPAFQGFLGSLDATGSANLTLALPALPVLQGLTLHSAALTVDLAHPGLIRQFSAPVTWSL
ncbi:MAG: hypothetical protein AAF628_15095 [Planctomycetota bacterium]